MLTDFYFFWVCTIVFDGGSIFINFAVQTEFRGDINFREAFCFFYFFFGFHSFVIIFGSGGFFFFIFLFSAHTTEQATDNTFHSFIFIFGSSGSGDE